MVIVNRTGQEYNPYGNSGQQYTGDFPNVGALAVRDGLYFRTNESQALMTSIEDVRLGVLPVAKLPLDAYQTWNEGGWKEQHGSAAAISRFLKKYLEEQREVDDVLEEYYEADKDPTHLIEEIGDVIWVTTALASTCGIVVSDALQDRLYSYYRGTKVWRSDGTFVHPNWHKTVGKVVVREEPLQIGHIDKVMQNGFEPQHSPVMNIDDEEQNSTVEHVFALQLLAAYMKDPAEALMSQEYPTLSDRSNEARTALANVTAETWLRVGYIANVLRASLADVVELNIDKIDRRIQSSTVDKSDGER